MKITIWIYQIHQFLIVQNYYRNSDMSIQVTHLYSSHLAIQCKISITLRIFFMILRGQACQYRKIGDQVHLLFIILIQLFLINSIKNHIKKQKATLLFNPLTNNRTLDLNTNNLFIKKVHSNSKSNHSG